MMKGFSSQQEAIKNEPGPLAKLLLGARNKNVESSTEVQVKPPDIGQGSMLVEKKENEKDLNWYLPLYRAALNGDWESARKFFDQDPDAITAKITKVSGTALHVAVGSGKAIDFVKELLELIPTEGLATLRDQVGQTVLHYAAIFGNVEAAKLLVSKDPALPNTPCNSYFLPIHAAAGYANKNMVSFLLTVTRDDAVHNPFAGGSGVDILNLVILAEFYDLALYLVQLYPYLATLRSSAGNTALNMIARKPSAFFRESSLCFWERFIYSWFHKWQLALWKFIECLVPRATYIRDTRMMHVQALQLVKCLCKEIAKLDYLTAASMFNMPILSAASSGNSEIVEEILESFPHAIWSVNPMGHNIFLLAVINRRENVFNLLYQMSEHKKLATQLTDNEGNNILHLVGKLAPPARLNLVSGAALQMQRELQWYKEVEKYVTPDSKDRKNTKNRTPPIEFSEEHKDLIKEGEKWMKDTANSCTVAAALIATIAFAASITVPGGNNGDSGFPIFSDKLAFPAFAVFDALSLFSSTASMLMFLSILTARYAERDFLYSLPKRLIIGLVTLFLSITSMMIAFSATLYLVFGRTKAWTLVPIAALACLPVILFVQLQFPLLLEMIISTYRSRIFGKRSGRLLF
ncbi:ankyrin repeat-containing protein-like [Dorcoceras hygrometricum]|uniref:Ankyrin repeat-containing protein-like n=1 Tax=Dorcoceras hygrometricum TaxID=472368 RepID=A0A2Z7AX50_9LAMI|nr:ankyrin repeat-containing protein-like [Dorcoceras hygrometricum]